MEEDQIPPVKGVIEADTAHADLFGSGFCISKRTDSQYTLDSGKDLGRYQSITLWSSPSW